MNVLYSYFLYSSCRRIQWSCAKHPCLPLRGRYSSYCRARLRGSSTSRSSDRWTSCPSSLNVSLRWNSNNTVLLTPLQLPPIGPHRPQSLAVTRTASASNPRTVTTGGGLGEGDTVPDEQDPRQFNVEGGIGVDRPLGTSHPIGVRLLLPECA